MIRETIIVIEVKEVKKDWINESINNIEYAYNPNLVDENLLADIRNTITRREVE